jgi:nicotinamidase/pyrazinamidase
MQNDFCRSDGALYVKGAEMDVARLGKFTATHSDKIDHIIMTQDNHHVIDISHPEFWEDNNGNPPAPFTEINTENVLQGVWRPRYNREKAIEYLQKLEKQGEFPHVIWPEHCIIGSYGAAIVNEIMQPVRAWARKGNFFDVVIKGTNPLTEHFGALMANVPIEDSPETQLNTELVKKLQLFETILVAGEAKSHCVATTIKQMLPIKSLARKLVILEDCMSDVTGFETIALPIYEKAKTDGASFILSTEWP